MYQRSRLVRSWTHLERQRGSLGFVGGPGETQLEVDRRLIDNRIARLKKDIEAVKRTRGLHRKSRQKVPYPVVALVGYTNAGKSTLFNAVTHAKVMAKDILFATLDPTMRALKLPSGRMVILSDTVGFISELPTQLVVAFRATLEEVLGADILIHVRDISHPDSDGQNEDVHEVLHELGLKEVLEESMIEALNKIDNLDDHDRSLLPQTQKSVPLSALKGDGINDLLTLIDQRLAQQEMISEFTLDLEDGANIAWLYDHGQVLERKDKDLQTSMKVRLSQANLERFKQRDRVK